MYLKFVAETNSNMQNSVLMFTFSIFDRKCPFWANLLQQINCQFKLKLVTWSILSKQNTIMMFTFLSYD